MRKIIVKIVEDEHPEINASVELSYEDLNNMEFIGLDPMSLLLSKLNEIIDKGIKEKDNGKS